MWTREELKTAAKQAFRVNGYWNTFGAIFLVGLIIGAVSMIFYAILAAMSVVTPQVASFVSIAGLLFSFFIVYPFAVGQTRYFMEHVYTRTDISPLFFAFKRGYGNVVKITFLKYIKIFLWSLLLFIPGIIKSYEYIFVEYILAENPEIDSSAAFSLSKRMTQGMKFDIFVLELSFFGWYLLGILAFGIGTIFVVPYVQATMSELYRVTRARILNENAATMDILPGFGYGE